MTHSTLEREEIRTLIAEEIRRAIMEDTDVRYWFIGFMSQTFVQHSEAERTIRQILEHLEALREDANRQVALLAERQDSFEQRMEEMRQDFNRLLEAFGKRMDAFERRMEEMRQDFNRQLEAFGKRMDAFEERMDAFEKRMDAFERRMEEMRQDFNRQLEAFGKRMDAFERRMEEMRQDFNRRMDDLRQDFNQQILRLTEQHRSLEQRVEQGFARVEATLEALGARWGLMAEESFRSGMAGILRDQFGWQVERFLVMDNEGYVFGRPDQVEIDIAIHDGAHWLVEIRSSMSKPDMYTFVRKVELYERLRGVQVARRIVISPMIHPQAKAVAERLNIELYTSVYDVSPNLSESGEGGRMK